MPSAARTSSSRRSRDGSVGPYRLVREIGRGGMGSVWLAERSDDQFQKQVAIKLLSAGLPSSEALRRFRDERRILASLEHPHIARLLDAGRTDDGLHYIVMELVEGVPITEHCRARGARRPGARRAAADGRLRRPLRAPAPGGPPRPQAGEHPGGRRRPAAAPRLRHRQGAGPRFGRRARRRRCCTSPRRPTPAPSSCAACRRPPRATSTPWASSAASCLPAACPIDRRPTPRPPAPSRGGLRPTRRIGGQTAARLVGDLDAIVMKATRPQPQDRYASAEELAADLGRYLERRPVLARGGTLAYRVQRFVARHRAGAAAAAIALFAVLAGIGGVLWQASIARHERRVAEARFNDVRQLAGAMLFELYDGIAELAGLDRAAPGAGDQGAPVLRWSGARRRRRFLRCARAGVRLPPRRRRPVRFELREPRGHGRRARQLREGAAHPRRAALRRRERPGGTAASRPGPISRRVAVHLYLWQWTQARDSVETGVRLREALATNGDETDRRELAGAYFRLADVIAAQDPAASLVHRRRALQMFEALLAAHPGDEEAQRSMALASKTLGSALLNLDRLDEAEPHLVRALAIDEKRVAASPNSAPARLDLSFDLSLLATLRMNREDYRGALEYLESHDRRPQGARRCRSERRARERASRIRLPAVIDGAVRARRFHRRHRRRDERTRAGGGALGGESRRLDEPIGPPPRPGARSGTTSADLPGAPPGAIEQHTRRARARPTGVHSTRTRRTSPRGEPTPPIARTPRLYGLRWRRAAGRRRRPGQVVCSRPRLGRTAFAALAPRWAGPPGWLRGRAGHRIPAPWPRPSERSAGGLRACDPGAHRPRCPDPLQPPPAPGIRYVATRAFTLVVKADDPSSDGDGTRTDRRPDRRPRRG